MAATRTQIYLTAEQRARLDRLMASEGRSLAALVREAVDQYLDRPSADPSAALEAAFGSAPGFSVPSRGEWERRDRRLRDG